MNKNKLRVCLSTYKEMVICCLIWLLVFQSFLETLWSPFAYVDEIVACMGGFFLLKEILISKHIIASKETMIMVCFIVVFVLCGLLGNLIYQYQPIKAVLIDLITNVKFYFAILTGYYLINNISWENTKKYIGINLKVITIILFGLFILDRLFDIFPGEIRYGIKSAQLLYFHSTYLAGAVAFLIVMLTIFYEKYNIIYIFMNLLIMFMTLRGKAIASTAVYILLFVLCIKFKKKIKIKDIILLGIICIIVAWPMIEFYYVSLAGHSARSVMTLTSFEILKDYFPIGTGFGTYASHSAAEYYSPVYVKYGFLETEELSALTNSGFFDDTFWPIIIGQTGFVGILAYLVIICILLKKCLEMYIVDKYAYMGSLFVLIYLIISSMAEPAFNNSVAISLALVLGIMFNRYRQQKVMSMRE